MLNYIPQRASFWDIKKIQLTSQFPVALQKSLYQIVCMKNTYQQVRYNDHIYALNHILYLEFT